ncbi:MAG TPA: acetate--CoA ligase family protein [Pseudonocardiaceae bacterium]|nr:acetate--CoA ligase family protein [Pseudonocardiaceae bacterium]
MTTVLTEVAAKALLHDIGIPVSRPEVARDADEALAAAERIGYPVVLKVVSESITHKSDHGCVILNVRDEHQARQAFDSISANATAAYPDAVIEGIAVEAMARSGLEVIVGLQRDPTFGPTVVFGLGGTLVELLADVSMRVAPFRRTDAARMIGEIRAAPLLRGFREHPPRDTAAVEEIIVRLGELAEDDDIESVDLNPVIVFEQGAGAVVVDALITLRGDHRD